MINNRYIVSFFSTTLFYLLLAGLLFYLQTSHLIADQEPKEHVVQLSLNSFIPPKPIVQPEIKEVEPLPPQEPIEQPKVEELLEPKVQPKNHKIEQQKAEAPKPNVAPKPKPKKIKKRVKTKKKVKKKRIKKQKSTTKSSVREAKKAKVNRSAAKKDRFLSKIRQKINQNKRYPRIAKKRGMQGVVEVRFTILSNGSVGNITVKGPRIFCNSARYAIKSAFPVNVTHAPLLLPAKVRLTLRYLLR